MTTLNEYKMAALETLTGNTGDINDLEMEWLQTVTSETGTLNELWLAFLEDESFTTGTLNDRQMAYWGSLSHTGTWNDRAIQFWAAGGPSGGADSLLTDLVAWWSLDETSGTRVNAHNPGTYDLTDNNTVGYDTGVVGNAASFAGGGNDESLTLANHSDFEFADTPFTVAMWVRPETGIESNAYVIGVGAPATVWTILRNGGAGSISFRVRNAANTSTAATAGIAYSLGTWALYIAEHDPDADEIRLSSNNGTPVSAALAGGGRITGTDAFIIGSNLGVEFVGLLDETAIWRRLLTSDEKARLYNSGAGMGYPG